MYPDLNIEINSNWFDLETNQKFIFKGVYEKGNDKVTVFILEREDKSLFWVTPKEFFERNLSNVH
jgi:hypothetical protein